MQQLLQTTAALRQGDSVAKFRIKLPPSRRGERCVAELTQFVATLAAEGSVRYNLQSVYSPGPHMRHQFYFDKLYDKKNTIETLVDRYKGHYANALKYFHPVKTVPQIGYEARKIKITMPPQSALFTLDPYLFSNVMAIAEATDMPVTVTEKDGSTTTTTYYGLFNLTDETVVRESSGQMSQREFLYRLLPQNLTDYADHTYVHIQLLATTKSFGLTDEYPTYEGAAVILDKIMTRTLRYHRLPADTVSFLESGGVVHARSREYPSGTAGSITVTLLEEGANFVGLPTTMHFPLSTATSYEGVPSTKVGSDPFAGIYPITILAVDSGRGNSYVEGSGIQSVLALVRKPETVVPVEAFALMPDTFLRVAFLDRILRRVQVREKVIVCLTFILKPLVA
jgi:hypothetical protein